MSRCEQQGVRDAATGERRAGGRAPLDAIDGGQIADLLAAAAAVTGALAGEASVEEACADAAPDDDGLPNLHIALAVAAADLDDAIAEHTCVLCPDPGPARGRGSACTHLDK